MYAREISFAEMFLNSMKTLYIKRLNFAIDC
jgi:hypothetical protein